MSNNRVPQQFAIPSIEIGHLQPSSNNMDLPLSELHGSFGSLLYDPSFSQYSLASKPTEVMASVSGTPMSQSLLVSHMQISQIDSKPTNLVSQKIQGSNYQFGMVNNMMGMDASKKFSLPAKRKSALEPIPHSFTSLQSSFPNKRPEQLGHRPWLQNVTGINKTVLEMQSTFPTPHISPGTSKKVAIEALSVKSGPQRSTIKTQSTMVLPKIRTESFESVRSKMKESLAAALGLASQQVDRSLETRKSFRNDGERIVCLMEECSQPIGPVCTVPDVVNNVVEVRGGNLSVKEDVSACQGKKICDKSYNFFENSDKGNTRTLIPGAPEFPPIDVLPNADILCSDNIDVKDELLQGNGLSWVLDPDVQVAERELQSDKNKKLNPEVMDGYQRAKIVQSPVILASKIEAELYKLYGGVNKKYKEKGRSLLFNLKDRSNPELSERVMSGEIPPERLCSMSAEELASKELSQWRMAKAEELAQMVVLPDSEVDIRRLVRKTHKGEFQVEIEHDSFTELPSAVSSFAQSPPNDNYAEPSSSTISAHVADEKKDEEANDHPCTFTIPSIEGSDLLQGLMVDDTLKDDESLPPIVSLDEFMESLNAEPPFENLPEDTGKSKPILSEHDPKACSETNVSAPMTEDFTENIPEEHNEPEDFTENIPEEHNEHSDGTAPDLQADVRLNGNHASPRPDVGGFNTKSNDAIQKSSEGLKKSGILSIDSPSNADIVWNGSLQLNVSSMTSTIGIFLSGEKVSAKDWPLVLDIKGRVRLDAFEKFLLNLPLSRSRAVMVVHFDLKEGCPENERSSLREVADSYVLDERVGFAEPVSGVELYLCPLNKKTLEMISKIMLKEHAVALNAIDNGLIGVVVWRKKVNSTSTISPNSNSFHKHSYRKHFSSRRQHDANLIADNIAPQEPPLQGLTLTGSKSLDEMDDDVPPGFGPADNRDEDDLPEFNFSAPNSVQGHMKSRFLPHSQQTPHPMEEMRKLIHKYGQTNANPENRKEEEDDIPEWNPGQDPPERRLPSPYLQVPMNVLAPSHQDPWHIPARRGF